MDEKKETKVVDDISEKETIYNQELSKESKQEINKLNEEAEKLAEQIEVFEEENADKKEAEVLTKEVEEEKIPEIEKEPDSQPLEVEKIDVVEEQPKEEKIEEPVVKEKLPEKKEKKKVHIPQPVKYAMFAISAGIIQLIVSNILYAILKNTEWGMMNFIIEQEKAQFTANTVGLALSILWNFTFNRKYTFKSAGNVPRAMFLSFLFYVPFYPFQIWCEPTLQNAIAPGQEWSYLISLLVVMLTNGILEFCWQKFVIYRKEENTAVQK